MNAAHLANQERAWLCSLAPAGNPIYCLIGHQIWGPLGKQDVCPNFALTAAKFLFSNSGNFRAKANLPQPRCCSKRPFGQLMGQNSSADWVIFRDNRFHIMGPIIFIENLRILVHAKLGLKFASERNYYRVNSATWE